MALAGNMTLSKEEEEYINIITKYLVPVMFSLVILIGSIGNILVIYVVRSDTTIKDIFEIFSELLTLSSSGSGQALEALSGSYSVTLTL